MNNSDFAHHRTNKRFRFTEFTSSSTFHRKKHKPTISNTASLHIKTFNIPLISSAPHPSLNLIRLEPYRPYAIGRNRKRCEFVFNDRRVSKIHCQILFDAFDKNIYIADGMFFVSYGEFSRVRVSLNGVFVNGVRIGNGEVVGLRAGDEVSLVCGNEGVCSMGRRIGFVVERISFVEEVFDRNVSNVGENGLCSDYAIVGSECGGIISKAGLLLSRCREILSKGDPILYIQKLRPKYLCMNLENNNSGLILSNVVKFPVSSTIELQCGSVKERNLGTKLDDMGQLSSVILHREVNSEQELCNVNEKSLQQTDNAETPFVNCFGNYKHTALPSSIISPKETLVVSEGDTNVECCNVNDEELQKMEDTCVPSENGIANGKPVAMSMGCMGEDDVPQHDMFVQDKNKGLRVPPPGNKFYLNRLHFMSHGSLESDNVVSLPELLYPVKTLVRVFIATFTSDISWFLSYCEIPADLPVTIACHNAGRCWSSSPDERTTVPYSDFPYLVVVYPPFPEAIAFGQDRKKLGIACHHPKLILLQREDGIRVIITSANLVPKQLAKFMASLVADVPSQVDWIMELTKYDFKGAVGHLVASIPGIHSPRIPYISESRYFLTGIPCVPGSCGVKLLGSVEASVVGLSHLFRTSADSNGSQLKRLAVFLRKCHENAYGMSEIVLRRNTNIPADANAVSVLIPNPEEFSEEDYIQLGFLPRNIAKWVAPLSDAGLFAFSAYIYPKDVLASALEGINNKVQLILYVSQGPSFMDMSLFRVTKPLLVSAVCLLVTSIQRSAGLWRLQEVLGNYKWPEYLETDFIFGSSSIGAVNAQFLAAFSAAAGKRSLQFSESEESDPDWGCWSASQESRNPSIKIIFPTIERVKSASCGILASKYLLCFSQKTWLRLRNVGILRDAIPYPIERVGHPMHVKVAQRRFQSKTDTSSFGWVYCGSHNFSAAAWGRPISNSRLNGVVRTNPVLGSRLHISNYELGIIFIVPPSDTNNYVKKVGTNLDEIVLPFVVPAPKYKQRDRPATAQAMREALAELTEQEKQRSAETGDLMEEEMPNEEEEVLEASDYVTVEKEDEKVYAEKLWSQVDSSQSC